MFSMNESEKSIEIQEDIITNEDFLWPPKLDITYVGLVALGSIIAWFVGGITILVFIYFFLWRMKGFEWAYPIIYSLTWFFSVWVTSYLTLLMHQLIAWDKYKKWVTTFTQVSIFLIFLYIFMAPAYLYAANVKIELLTYIFTIHIIISILWTSIMAEVISSYRYVLLWLYGSFIWFFISILISVFIFLNYPTWKINLYALIWIIIVMNFMTNTVRAIFEYVYYLLFKFSWTDYLWDIFGQIESEEREIEKKVKENLETFK